MIKRDTIIFFILAFLAFRSNSQDVMTREALITSYTYNFSKNIIWPESSYTDDFFRISIFGATTELRNNFNILSTNRKVENKEILVDYTGKYFSPRIAQVVLLYENSEVSYDSIQKYTAGYPVLIITDNMETSSELMINFRNGSNNKVLYEINYKAILNRGMDVSPDMILIGGDQQGVAEIIQKNQQEIEEKNSSITKLERELSNKSYELERLEKTIKNQLELVNTQKKVISEQELTLKKQKTESVKLIDDINKQRNELELRINDLSEKEKELSLLQENINNVNEQLSFQRVRVDSVNSVIFQKTNEVGELSDQLIKQRQVVVLLAIASFLALSLIIVITYFYTRISKAKAELERQKTNLIHSEKMASIGTLAAGVAHELNNPLNVISGTIQILTKTFKEVFENEDSIEAQEKEDIEILLKESKKSIKKSLQIISGLNMSVSRSSAPLEIKLTDLLENVINLQDPKIFEEIEIKNIVQPEKIRCFPDKIHYVINTILDNAIKAVNEIDGNKKIEISSDRTSKYTLLKIQNNGPLIPDNIVDHIFDPFFTTREPGEGNGLGLYNSYNIMKEHDGDLQVINSEPVIFILKIPLNLV